MTRRPPHIPPPAHDDDVPTCTECGHQHLTRPHRTQACIRHRSNRDDNGNLVPCSKYPIRGGVVCRSHGAGASHVKAAAARRLEMAAATRAAARELAALGEPIAVDPAAALLQLVHYKAGEVAWLRAMVQTEDLDDLVWGVTREKVGGDDAGTTREAKPSIWWAMLRSAEDQLADYSSRAIKAGLDERRIEMEHEQGVMVAGMVERVLRSMFDTIVRTLRGLGVGDDQIVAALQQAWVEAVQTIVPREFRALTEGA